MTSQEKGHDGGCNGTAVTPQGKGHDGGCNWTAVTPQEKGAWWRV